MFDWRRPRHLREGLGGRDGRLAPCKRSPNCVCSQADPADRLHFIEPIAYGGGMARLRGAIERLPLARVIRAEGPYLYAEFRTPVLRFVDDLELLQQGEWLHVRSASRLGRRDFGVNRRRVEELRALIAALR